MPLKLDWERLIKEHSDWEAYNFPNVELVDDLMGVIEECGELAHHHLKQKQGIRTNEDHIAEMQDAVGDITVYLLGVMYHMDMRFGPEWWQLDGTYAPQGTDGLILFLGNDVGCVLGVHLGVTAGTQYHVSRLIHTLRRYCREMGWDYEQIVTDTWNKVKQRDWQKDPVKGVSEDPTPASPADSSVSATGTSEAAPTTVPPGYAIDVARAAAEGYEWS